MQTREFGQLRRDADPAGVSNLAGDPQVAESGDREKQLEQLRAAAKVRRTRLGLVGFICGELAMLITEAPEAARSLLVMAG